MDNFYRVNERLKEALELRNMTPAELSRRSNVDKGAICKYMQGKTKPKSEALIALSNALHVSPIWLLGLDDTEQPKITPTTDLEDAGIDISILTKNNRNKLIGYYQALVDSQKK